MSQQSTPHSDQDQPLTLAVHALPDIIDPDFVDAAPSGRGKLIVILFACLLPLLLLYLIFFVARPLEQNGFGVAMAPRAVPDLALSDSEGQSVTLAAMKGQWRLIGVGPSHCEDRCVKHLFIQRQLREMLLKKNLRIERLWLLLDEDPVPEKLQHLLQGAQVLRVTPEQAGQITGLAPAQAASQLFVEDADGRLVMRMPADQDSAQVRAAMWTLQTLISTGSAPAVTAR